MPDWGHVRLSSNLVLSVHPDLEITQASSGPISLTMLGYMLDPYHPQLSNLDILQNIADSTSSFYTLLSTLRPYSGRWILIYRDSESIRLLNDPAGLRQAFFLADKNQVYCSSQPALMLDILGPVVEMDTQAKDFIASPLYESSERFWPGDRTPYIGIKHLLPNHYLDLNTGKSTRYWPHAILPDVSFESAISTSAQILTGTFQAAKLRKPLMLAVTAGWDSRILLAASKDISNKLFYYIIKVSRLSDESDDIRIPSRLLKQLNLRFHVLDMPGTINPDFLKAFMSNTTEARQKLVGAIAALDEDYSGMLKVSGMVAEIARNFYSYCHGRHTDGRLLAEIAGTKDLPFAVDGFQLWLSEAEKAAEDHKIDILDLFYWEQRAGNWAAMGCAEADMANDELCPFNNRLLMETLLGVDRSHRMPPDYPFYKALIKYMWPETLRQPINPPGLLTRIKRYAKGAIRILKKLTIR